MTNIQSRIFELIDYLDTHISKELPSEWAEKNRVLTSDVTGTPGKQSFERFPFWREPLDNLSVYSPVRIQTIMGSAQIGKSTNFVENGIGYYIKNAPCNMVMTVTDKEMSDLAVVKKIDNMIYNSGLSHLIGPNTKKKRNKRTGDTQDLKEFAGGSIMFFSVKAVDKISHQNSFRVGFFDDFDASTRSQQHQGDIISLLFQRFNAYKDVMKINILGTPEIKNNSGLEYCFLKGDQRYYMMPCPLCGAYIKFIWYEKIESTGEKIGVYFEKDDHGHLVENSVGYICQECKGFFTEKHKRDMLAHGKWIPTATPSRPDWLSYHINCLYSPPGFFDWKHYAHQWIDMYDGGKVVRKKLQVFVNQILGQTFEEKGKEIKISQLAQNTRPYKIGVVPCALSEKDGNGRIVMLTCACDLNGKIDDARIDYEVLAHSETGCTYSIDAGSIGTFQRGLNETERELWTYRNNERTNNVWDVLLRDVLQRTYKADNSRSYQVLIAGIDTGNFTTYAYSFVDSHVREKVPLMIVGIKGDVTKVRKVGADTEIFHLSKEKDNLYLLEVNQLKDIIADRVEMVWNEDSGLSQPTGFMNFPEPEDGKYTYKGYFMQYEAEQKVPKLNADGTEVGYVWQKKHSTVANHFFDCAVYGPALRDIFVENFLKSMKIKDINWSRFCQIVKKAQTQ